MMTHDEMITVIQAHRDGKVLEACDAGTGQWTWCRQPPSWDFREYDYRVKPEPTKPREFWICYDKDSNLMLEDSNPRIYSREQELSSRRAQIHVREVL